MKPGFRKWAMRWIASAAISPLFLSWFLLVISVQGSGGESNSPKTRHAGKQGLSRKQTGFHCGEREEALCCFVGSINGRMSDKWICALMLSREILGDEEAPCWQAYRSKEGEVKWKWEPGLKWGISLFVSWQRRTRLNGREKWAISIEWPRSSFSPFPGENTSTRLPAAKAFKCTKAPQPLIFAPHFTLRFLRAPQAIPPPLHPFSVSFCQLLLCFSDINAFATRERVCAWVISFCAFWV